MLRPHVEEKHPASLKSCKHCGLKFLAKSTLGNHIMKKHSSHHACDQCTNVYKRKSTLDAHIRKTHPVAKTRRVFTKRFASQGRAQPLQECSKCHEKFKTEEKLRAHQHSCLSSFECNQCGKILMKRAYLDYHMRSVHSNNRPNKGKSKSGSSWHNRRVHLTAQVPAAESQPLNLTTRQASIGHVMPQTTMDSNGLVLQSEEQDSTISAPSRGQLSTVNQRTKLNQLAGGRTEANEQLSIADSNKKRRSERLYQTDGKLKIRAFSLCLLNCVSCDSFGADAPRRYF